MVEEDVDEVEDVSLVEESKLLLHGNWRKKQERNMLMS